MGIPGLFRQILDKYSDSYGWDSDRVDYFLLDANTLIYGVYHRVDDSEKAIISGVIEKLKELFSLVKPRKGIYLAFDGPTPVAKMITSKERRYKKVKLNKYMEDLGLPKSVKSFDDRLISPGTEFMDNLSKEIEKEMIKGGFLDFLTEKEKKGFQFIFSDTHVPGEGEHKIMPFIKNMTKDETATIFSPDADLIILGIFAKNLRIMREVHAGDPEILEPFREDKGGPGYMYLYLDKFKEYLVLELGLKGMDEDRVIIDYAFCVSLTGNDFVVPLDYFQTRKRGALDQILDAYVSILRRRKSHLVIPEAGKTKINMPFFIEMCDIFSRTELDEFQKIQRMRNRDKKTSGLKEQEKGRYSDMTDEEKKKAIFIHMNLYRPIHPLYREYVAEFNKINFYDSNWKEQYYRFHLGIDSYEVSRFIDLVCQNFMESLQFVMDYYMFGCPNYFWYGKFEVAPLMSDLVKFLRGLKPEHNFGSYSDKAPPTALEQMAIIMPPEMSKYLPKELGKLMTEVKSPIIDQYPIDFKLNVFSFDKLEYARVKLPPLALHRVLSNVNKLVLTPKEKKLVSVRKEPITITL